MVNIIIYIHKSIIIEIDLTILFYLAPKFIPQEAYFNIIIRTIIERIIIMIMIFIMIIVITIIRMMIMILIII